MKKLILFSLILSFGIVAQEKEDKYITFKPVTWDELQLYQLDSMLSTEELNLSQTCPRTLKKLKESHTKLNSGMQNILFTHYFWTEYIDLNEKKCLVKHDRINSINQKNNEIVNPNTYELLNVNQARVLLSASRGIGFNEKGYDQKIIDVNRHNQKLNERGYEKYGGKISLINYMEKNKPAYKVDKSLLESLTTIEDGTVTTTKIPLIELFEMRYSVTQKLELIELTKKNNEKKTM